MDLREQIGQRLVTGFPGTELTEDDPLVLAKLLKNFKATRRSLHAPPP